MAWAVRQHPVSSPRSSNRTCRFPASGFPTGFIARHTVDGQRLVSRDDTMAYAHLRLATQLFQRFRIITVFPGSSPITNPLHLPKHTRSQGPLLRQHYPASTLV